MCFKFITNNLFKAFSIPLIGLIIYGMNIFSKDIKANTKAIAANKEDIYLYRQMGASYFCMASNAEIEFKKAIGVASAAFSEVVLGKHEGLIEEAGDKKLGKERLFYVGRLQIMESALRICPQNVPEKEKTAFETTVKKLMEENKNIKNNKKGR